MAVPKKNTAFTFAIGLVDQSARPSFKAAPTLADGDFKVDIDGAGFNNLASLPTVTPAAGRLVVIALSAAEMNGDVITVQCVDAAGAQWDDVLVVINTSVRNVDDLAFPATSGRSMVVDASGLVDANAVKVGPTGAGTAQTARDIGASVLVGDKTGFALSATGSAAMTEGYPTLGGTGTLPQLLYAILQHLEEASISGTTKTVKKRDQATTAETLTLNSATAPTSVTRAT